MAQLVNQAPNVAQFIRRDGHSIELGVVVNYRLAGLPFEILASRDGVQFRGTFPRTDRTGMTIFKDMLDRAVRQHEHLATFVLGDLQTTIPEEVFEEEEAQRDARAGKAVALSPSTDTKAVH